MEERSDYQSFLEKKALRKKKMKIKKTAAISILILLILAALLSLSGGKAKKDASVTIPEGSGTMQIARILKDEGIISGSLRFALTAQFSSYRGKLQYGDFDFQKGMSYNEMIAQMATDGAKRKTVSVTIPEGFSVENIITRLTEAGLSDEKSLNKALEADYEFEFLKGIKKQDGCRYRLQGFLFPATYEFYSDISAEEIVRTMLQCFEDRYKSTGQGYENLYETITLASMVEREAKLDSERATIAGVIENRLAAGMKLQIDATVVYAISDGAYNVNRVLYKDLKVDSVYNTYRNAGLPKGPICNPGLASIQAAQHPEKHDYLFYHTDTQKNDGSHIFTKSFEEHKSTQ